jgi:hypothetical protein
MKKTASIISILLISVLLFSCGKTTIKIAYNNIDTVMHFMINRYLKLEAGQSEVLKNVLAKHLYWIRKEGFKNYITLLTEFKPKMSGKITIDDVHWAEKSFEKHQVILFKKVYPDILNMIYSLDKKQIANIKLEIEKRRQKEREEASKPREEQLEKSFEGLMKMMKFIYGDFTDEQKYRIKMLAKELPEISEESSKYNKERIDHFLYVLENRKNNKEIEVLVNKYFFSNIKDMPEYYRKKGEQLKSATEQFVIKLHNDITTQEQKNKASEKIGEVIEAFRELQAQP